MYSIIVQFWLTTSRHRLICYEMSEHYQSLPGPMQWNFVSGPSNRHKGQPSINLSPSSHLKYIVIKDIEYVTTKTHLVSALLQLTILFVFYYLSVVIPRVPTSNGCEVQRSNGVSCPSYRNYSICISAAEMVADQEVRRGSR